MYKDEFNTDFVAPFIAFFAPLLLPDAVSHRPLAFLQYSFIEAYRELELNTTVGLSFVRSYRIKCVQGIRAWPREGGRSHL